VSCAVWIGSIERLVELVIGSLYSFHEPEFGVSKAREVVHWREGGFDCSILRAKVESSAKALRARAERVGSHVAVYRMLAQRVEDNQILMDSYNDYSTNNGPSTLDSLTRLCML
jgi:hypothetical protein